MLVTGSALFPIFPICAMAFGWSILCFGEKKLVTLGRQLSYCIDGNWCALGIYLGSCVWLVTRTKKYDTSAVINVTCYMHCFKGHHYRQGCFL